MRDKKRHIISIILIILIGIVIISMGNTLRVVKYEKLGLSEYKKGNHKQAIKYFSKAIEYNPNDASLYNNRGLAYYNLEQYNKAIADYTKAIEIKPNFADAYYNRGLAYLKKGTSYNLEPLKKQFLILLRQ